MREVAKAHGQVTLRYQFVFTETEGDVVLRIEATGELSVGCEASSAARKAAP